MFHFLYKEIFTKDNKPFEFETHTKLLDDTWLDSNIT